MHARAANGRGLIGGRFHFDYPSVGATETRMMAASLANGVTVLTNIAQAWLEVEIDSSVFSF